jgi:hypothetical protein
MNSIARFRLPTFDLRLGQRVAQTHNYTHQQEGFNYFLSPAESSHQVYMTAEGAGIKGQDYILLQGEQGTIRYQVEGIDYYGDSPLLWTALLVRC